MGAACGLANGSAERRSSKARGTDEHGPGTDKADGARVSNRSPLPWNRSTQRGHHDCNGSVEQTKEDCADAGGEHLDGHTEDEDVGGEDTGHGDVGGHALDRLHHQERATLDGGQSEDETRKSWTRGILFRRAEVRDEERSEA